MDCKKTLEYLYSLESPKIKLGLGRVQALLDKIGNPEKKLRCIHVAGTNGKGSVCAMIFYILKEEGYKVGLYTSPHLKKFNERLRINGKPITDREIVDYFLRLKPFITNQSFFEITTAIAFIYFSENAVDFAVLEVGLGGRLDATNVVTPLISVITNIGLEHTELLGHNMEKIAFEKAGIIKNNVPVVTGAGGDALKVIKKTAGQRNAPLYLAKKHPKISFEFLNGSFQQQNKDIALTTIDILRENGLLDIRKNIVIEGLRKTKWPGRLQFISRNVLVDCAHNLDGIKTLVNELKIIKSQKKVRNFIFVVGIQKDKDIGMMLRTIKPLATEAIFTKSKNEKASNPDELLEIYSKTGNKSTSRTISNPKKALKAAKKRAGKNDMVVVAGSIYLAGEVIG